MDLNGDGKMDLLTGSFDGGPYLLEGLGDGRFAEPRPVLDRDGARILISSYWDYEERKWTELESSGFPGQHAVSVTTVDWDGDGDLDLLLGSRSGKLFLRINEGSPECAEFATRNEQARAGNSDLAIPGGDVMVVTADWDGDGAWDIIGGNSAGEVYWLRNKGRSGEPMFDAAKKLVNASALGDSTGEDAALPGTRIQVSVGDHNGDGLPDLLLGDYHSQTAKGTEFTPERRDELLKEMSSIRPKPSMHGWVWLFERRK